MTTAELLRMLDALDAHVALVARSVADLKASVAEAASRNAPSPDVDGEGNCLHRERMAAATMGHPNRTVCRRCRTVLEL